MCGIEIARCAVPITYTLIHTHTPRPMPHINYSYSWSVFFIHGAMQILIETPTGSRHFCHWFPPVCMCAKAKYAFLHNFRCRVCDVWFSTFPLFRLQLCMFYGHGDRWPGARLFRRIVFVFCVKRGGNGIRQFRRNWMLKNRTKNGWNQRGMSLLCAW